MSLQTPRSNRFSDSNPSIIYIAVVLISLLLLVAIFQTGAIAGSTTKAAGAKIPGQTMNPDAAAGQTDLTSRITQTLADHVEGKAIRSWLGQLTAGSLEMEAAEWILAWLPTSDLVGLELTELKEHVLLAAETYREIPWRDQLPRSLWLRFIVPHRVSQEPAQKWRRLLHDQIWPRVRSAESMELAALEVNRWCREQATFKSTSGRDMGPLTTMKRGIGRCEEEMILTICAMRSVGIPARSCATPYWTFCDNNHAWVEAWADGRWFYLGGCEPGNCLNDAWFTNSARRTGFVRSIGYGEFAPENEQLYRAEDGCTIINSTAVYTTPFTLTARVDGLEDGLSEIYINVMNFGSLRPIARIPSGSSLEIGPGEYVLTSSELPEEDSSSKPVSNEASARAENIDQLLFRTVRGQAGDSLDVTLTKSDRYDFDTSPGFWLRYAEGEATPKRDLNLVTDSAKHLHNLRVRAADEDRAKLRQLNEREQAVLDTLPSTEHETIRETLEKPMGHTSMIFQLLEIFDDQSERAALCEYLSRTDDKDLLELGIPEITSQIDYALAVRWRLEPIGLAIPDSLFYEDILAGRINYESGGAWHKTLPLVPLEDTPESSLAALLTLFRERLDLTERVLFGNTMHPGDTWLVRRGTSRDLSIALVGLLRRNGFPARYRFGITEVWLGNWVRLDPEAGQIYQAPEPVETAANMQTDTPDTPLEGPGTLNIAITRGGLPYPQAQSYANFNVSRPQAGHMSSPWWDPGIGEQEWDSGTYILSSAMRVPGGSIYCRLKRFTIEPGKVTNVSLPVDIDPTKWDHRRTLISDLGSGAVDLLLSQTDIVQSENLPLPETGLYFFFEPGEPADRMIAALGNLTARLEKLEITLVPVLLGDRPEVWSEKLIEAGLPGTIWRDVGSSRRLIGDLGQVLKQGFEPVVALMVELVGDDGSTAATEMTAITADVTDDQLIDQSSAHGAPIMLRQGFDSGVDGTVHLALDLVEGRLGQ